MVKKRLKGPIHVHWELTNKCNLKCLHCYQQDDEVKSHSLQENEVIRIAKELINIGIFNITLTGGEPFLLDFLNPLVQFFNSYGLIPQISSNGTIINDDMLNWVEKSKVKLQISLDSSRSDIHDYLRGKQGTFNKCIQTIQSFTSRKVPVSIAFCANKINFIDIEEMIKLSIRLGVDKITIGELLPFFGENNERLVFSMKDYIEFLEYFEEVKLIYNEKILIEHISEWGFVFSKKINHVPCSAGERDLAILYNGFVTPCPFVRHPNYFLGDLLTNSLAEVWESRETELWNNQKHEGCPSSCKHFQECMSGCKAFIANKGFSLNIPNHFCKINDINFI